MGDCILSSLSIPPHSRTMISTEQTTCDNQSEPLEEFVDDFEVEIVTLTDYEEVELGLGQEEVEDGNDDEAQTMEDEEEPKEMPAEDVEEEEKVMEDHEEGDLESNSHLEEAENDSASAHHQTSSGPHICSVCEKSFKFASALIAHQVIHTGERPYVCHLCGRCFSFRQSLDRHKQTHKDGRVYDCLICGETFQSLSARTEHKKSHMEQGAYQCSQCHRKFNWASAMVRHLKVHTEGTEVKTQELTKSLKSEKEDIGIKEIVGEVAIEPPETDPVLEDGGKSCHNPQEGAGQSTSSEPAVLVPGLLDKVVTLVKVRTSGRKTKPTLKVQMVNLQKLKGKVATPKRRTDGSLMNPQGFTPLHFKSEEHSYGSPVVSTKEGDTGWCPFVNSDEASVQQHIETNHSGKSRKMLCLLRTKQAKRDTMIAQTVTAATSFSPY
ncbi:zinc finger protein 436-like isoform X2 [Oncorhynchus keta]|uniref:zinc finger protein 436-like isoform X2 n=1 Tax=Oncorhynchus keta TaxID=8018 RepID=UPI00227C50FD|nr:zinc finger protein 436-like isoform X2 [Oncorhynchus keta]